MKTILKLLKKYSIELAFGIMGLMVVITTITIAVGGITAAFIGLAVCAILLPLQIIAAKIAIKQTYD